MAHWPWQSPPCRVVLHLPHTVPPLSILSQFSVCPAVAPSLTVLSQALGFQSDCCTQVASLPLPPPPPTALHCPSSSPQSLVVPHCPSPFLITLLAMSRPSFAVPEDAPLHPKHHFPSPWLPRPQSTSAPLPSPGLEIDDDLGARQLALQRPSRKRPLRRRGHGGVALPRGPQAYTWVSASPL